MTFDPLLFALLSLAALVGWLIGRQRGTRKTGERVSQLSSVYFRGLNYLLNEQPDKAIELFLEIAEVDSDTVDTQLALGTLFRRRGEVERAIRLHQGLVARPGLSDEHKVQAILELGEDYMRAGLLDRAETLFTDLVRMEVSAPQALRHLITIYQSERDWARAIEHAERFRASTGEDVGPLISHLHCELVESARGRGDIEQAQLHLRQAHVADPGSVRVAMIQAQLARERSDWHSAVLALERVIEYDPDFLPEVVEPLLDCYRRLGEADGARDFLDRALGHEAGVAAVLAKTRWLVEHDGDQAALSFLSDQLVRHPSVRGQAALIELIVRQSPEPGQPLAAVASVTDQILARSQPYRCERCGFGGKSLHWQCPSCKAWGTTKPMRLLATC